MSGVPGWSIGRSIINRPMTILAAAPPEVEVTVNIYLCRAALPVVAIDRS